NAPCAVSCCAASPADPAPRPLADTAPWPSGGAAPRPLGGTAPAADETADGAADAPAGVGAGEGEGEGAAAVVVRGGGGVEATSSRVSGAVRCAPASAAAANSTDR